MAQLHFIKIENFCASKDIVNKETAHYRMGVIFANHLSEKGFISRIHKDLINSKRQKIQFTSGPIT